MNPIQTLSPACSGIRWLLTLALATSLAASGQAVSPKPGSDWAFKPPVQAKPPTVREGHWVINPVDSFVLARLEQARLKPTPAADKPTLLRRVTFDLTGMLPTAAEREAFLADTAPGDYERLVDRLLGSPQFGERWAQHWLDVVRYADSEGYKLDRMRPDAYRYRDYVIRAFNEDLPYDRFVAQQVAGDELEPRNPQAQIATGFLRMHAEETNASNYRQVRQDILDDVTDVSGMTFLGLTVGCARCHNHKFDPITQRDYFAFQSFFAPLIQRESVPLASEAELTEYQVRQADWEEATSSLRARVEALVAEHRRAIANENSAAYDSETQESLALPEAQRTVLQQQLALLALKQLERKTFRPQKRLTPEQRAEFDSLIAQIALYDHLKPTPLPTMLAAQDVGPKAPPVYRLAGGNYLRPKEEVAPAFLGALGGGQPVIRVPADLPNSTGRRSALARWLVQPDNPLTARVIVNRLWQHYLGRGLVETPNDFGAQGQAPTHPELLDYLAVELVRNGWHLKAIHRLIVTSATYRQASQADLNPNVAEATRTDANNRLLWHARVKRREAESIRDVLLQLSGNLNPRMFGPSARPELPEALMVSRYSWYADERIEDRNRRSVYVLVKRNMQYPMFGAFDEPDHLNSCPSRSTTVTAPQALVMLHGHLAQKEPAAMALRLLKAYGEDRAALIRAAYLDAFGRPPTAEEIAAATDFLDRQGKLIEPHPDTPLPPGHSPTLAGAVADFCHALMNSAELLYVE